MTIDYDNLLPKWNTWVKRVLVINDVTNTPPANTWLQAERSILIEQLDKIDEWPQVSFVVSLPDSIFFFSILRYFNLQ
jgi:hypothetical protein